MPDDFEVASNIEMQARERSIAAQLAKASKTPRLTPKGECLNPNCGEEFEQGSLRLFCGPKCAHQHQIFNR